MTPRMIDTPPSPGTTEWRRIISASKVPAILGISRFQSQYALWHEMAGTVPVEPKEGNHLRWGHLMEKPLADWWAQENPEWQLNPGGEIAYTDPDLPFPNMATLDRRGYRRRGRRFHVIECKTARDIDTWGPVGEQDSIPADYYSQVMFQMGVSGIHEASLVVPNYSEAEIHPVEFDQHLFDGIVDRCMQWWQSLEKGTPPPLDDHPTTYETVRGLHPDIDRDGIVHIDSRDAAALLDLVHAEDDAKAAARAAKIRAAELMGSARVLMCGDVKIADRRAKSGSTPYVQFNKKAQVP